MSVTQEFCQKIPKPFPKRAEQGLGTPKAESQQKHSNFA